MRTKGLFMNDPQRIAATKNAAGFQVQELKTILSINPSLKEYMDKQMRLEDKKLALVRQNRIYADTEVKIQMKRTEKDWKKVNRRILLNTWQKDPKN